MTITRNTITPSMYSEPMTESLSWAILSAAPKQPQGSVPSPSLSSKLLLVIKPAVSSAERLATNLAAMPEISRMPMASSKRGIQT